MMERQIASRRSALKLIAQSVALGAVPALAVSQQTRSASVIRDPKWMALVADYHAKHTIWLEAVDVSEAANDAFIEASKALPEPVAPTAAFNEKWPLTKLVAACQEPGYKRAFAKYEKKRGELKAQRKALQAELCSAAAEQYSETYDAWSDSFDALVSYRVPSLALLAEKIDLILKHCDGGDADEVRMAAILDDVRHLTKEVRP